MKGWTPVELAEVCTIVGGGTPTRNNSEYYGGSIPWVTPKDMKTWEIRGAELCITQVGVEHSATRLVPANTVLVVVRSGVLKHTIPVAISRLPVAINQDMKAILCSDRLHPDFLARFLKARSPTILQWVRATTADNFPVDRLRELQVPLPPLPEQRRIAGILDKADALRAKRRAALAQIDTLTQSIFLDLFGDTVSNPKGWPLVPLPSVIYFQEGPGVRNWQFRKEGIKLVNVGNIVDGLLVTENTERHLDSLEVEQRYKHFLLDAGDFVVASSGVTWGKIAEVEERHLPLCLNTSMIRFRPLTNGVEKRFIRSFIESPAFRLQIVRLITGSAQPNFGPAHLKQVRVPLPPIKLQREFARRVSAVEKLKTAQRASLAELDALFATLQHHAFRGEL